MTGNVVSEYNNSKTDVIKDSHRSFPEAIETNNFAPLQKEFDSQLSNQSRFFKNFMKLFELILFFVRASRDQLWELHLQSLHALCPYFFALDMINYESDSCPSFPNVCLKRKILKLGNFYPTEDFQLTNQCSIFFHWIKSPKWARGPCTKGYRGNKGHCTSPAGSR